MKFHIVRNDETLEDILYLYNLTKDELVEQNRHIRVWNKLIPGTKLRIPPIPETVQQEVTEMEPFVEDYYPKLTPDNLEPQDEEGITEESEEIDIVSTEEENQQLPITEIPQESAPAIVSKEELMKKQEEIKKEVQEKIKQMNMVRSAPITNPPTSHGYYPRYTYIYPVYYQKRS